MNAVVPAVPKAAVETTRVVAFVTEVTVHACRLVPVNNTPGMIAEDEGIVTVVVLFVEPVAPNAVAAVKHIFDGGNPNAVLVKLT